MAKNTTKILVLVEGTRPDVTLMKKLFSIYEFDAKYEIVPYSTNIYTLYKELFEHSSPDEIDLLQLLKSREPDPVKKALFDDVYSDVLLIFDLDPQDPEFTAESIRRMAEYFIESSDMGKLYINYPMVEAFYHMTDIPDENFDSYFATMEELVAGSYKARVNRENRNHDYRKFAVDRRECNLVINQNLSKAYRIISHEADDTEVPTQHDILMSELAYIQNDRKVAVLSTCAFFIPEYNPKLIKE